MKNKIICKKENVKKYIFLNILTIVSLDSVGMLGLIGIYKYNLLDSLVAYLVYAISFYGFVVTSVYIFSNTALMKKRITKTKFVQKYQNDIQFKMKTRLFLSSSINLLYAGFKLVIGYLYLSVWEFNIGIYYLLLFIIRFILLRQVNYEEVGENKKEEYRKSIRCGYCLIILNLILSAVVVLMIKENYTYNYPGYIIYVVALYAFYNIITGTINLIKYNKYHSPIINTANAICFISALVSMLALQTAMMTQFGNNSIQTKQLANGLTGSIICIAVFIISLYMVLHSKKNLDV